MATIQFRLSTKADKSTGKAELLVRFFHGPIDLRGKSNIFVAPEHWNQKGQRVTVPRVRLMTNEAKELIADLQGINTKIEALREYINQAFIEAGAGKVSVPRTWLSDLLDEYNFPNRGAQLTFFDLFAHFIEVREISETRKHNYLVAMRAFKRFVLYRKLNESRLFEDLSVDTIREFSQYLKDEHTMYQVETDKDGKKVVRYLNPDFRRAYEAVPASRLPEPRGQNSINVLLNKLRSFLIWAVNNEHTTNNPFAKFNIPQSIYGTPYYITIEERNRLFAWDFSSRPNLAVQRDIFVFQCVVGCRVSDLRNLTKDCVIDGAIEYIPRKTKEGDPVTVRVPLNSVARTILERYKDIPGKKLLPCIADQNYNYAIKDIFREAGLNRMVTILNPTTREEEKRPLYEVASSHIARRCFIGNLYKQVKDPNLIGKLSGHTEGSKAFARYRDIDEDIRKELVGMLE